MDAVLMKQTHVLLALADAAAQLFQILEVSIDEVAERFAAGDGFLRWRLAAADLALSLGGPGLGLDFETEPA